MFYLGHRGCLNYTLSFFSLVFDVHIGIPVVIALFVVYFRFKGKVFFLKILLALSLRLDNELVVISL